MSNQTFVKKDRISFAQNLNETIVIAPSNITTNTLFIGPNSAITYDTNSNIANIQTLNGITLSNQYIYADGTYLSNIPSGNITSSLVGLATFGYVSTSQLVSSINSVYGVYVSAATLLSSIQGYGNSYISSSTLLSAATGIANNINSAFSSTINGLGNAGYISSQQLTSTVTGLGSIYISSSGANQSNINSTITGLGTAGYVSSQQLTSTVRGLGNLYLSSFNTTITSTVIGLGRFGYISSSQLVSTVTGLATAGYISTSTLVSSVANWWIYPALGTVNLSNNIISNVQQINVDVISSATIGHTDFLNFINLQNNPIYAVTNLQVDTITANNYGVVSFSNGVNFLGPVDFCNNYTSNNYYNLYSDLDIGANPTGLINGFVSFYGLFSYFNSNIGFPRAIAADWWNFNAGGTVDMNNYSINNINSLQLMTSTPYYANMNLTYTFSTFPDPINFYSGTYEIFNIDGIPFSMLNTSISLFTIPNLYTLVFPDLVNNYYTYLYANSNDNDRFYYNVFNVTGQYQISNRAIAQDWSFYRAEHTVDISGFDIVNVSTLGFADRFNSTSNSILSCSNTLLYYNYSNEIIGGTLQYLPQLISFAPSFSPTSIAYLGLWMDAADSNTFVLDGFNNMLQWNDKSSNLNNFVPSLLSAQYNVSNVVFNAFGYYFYSSNSLTFDTNTYIFMVASLSNIGGIEMAFALNDIHAGDYSLRYNVGYFNNADSNDVLLPTYYANGIYNATIDFSQRHIIDGVFNTSGTSIMRISSDFNSRYFYGTINEIIIYNGPTMISGTDITNVRNYLATKWSIII